MFPTGMTFQSGCTGVRSPGRYFFSLNLDSCFGELCLFFKFSFISSAKKEIRQHWHSFLKLISLDFESSPSFDFSNSNTLFLLFWALQVRQSRFIFVWATFFSPFYLFPSLFDNPFLSIPLQPRLTFASSSFPPPSDTISSTDGRFCLFGTYDNCSE